MPRPAYSKERIDEIQAEILEAGLVVLAEKGVAGVSLRAIAERIGWTPAALYRYFPNKESLMAALRAEGFHRFSASLEEASARADTTDPGGFVRLGARAYLEFALAEPALFSLMYQLDQEAEPSPGYVQAARQRTFDIALALGETAVSAGLIAGDANTATHVIWAAAHGLASLALAHQLNMGSSYEDVIEPLLERISAPIAPGEPEE